MDPSAAVSVLSIVEEAASRGKSPVPPPPSPPRMDSWGARGGRGSRRRGPGSGSGSLGGGGAESEEEYLALCLLMLARGVRGDGDGDVKGAGAAAGAAATKGYECSVCGKVYASYQALGGHKTSHRKPPAPAPAASEEASGGAAVAAAAAAEAKVHRCSLCLRTFPSGQALGGHKRLHYEGGSAAGDGTKEGAGVKAKAAAALLRDFDLNLPAAAPSTTAGGDDAEAESAPPEAKRARLQVLLAAV